jgi:hypothetical protein
MPFPIPRSVIDALPSTTAGEAEPVSPDPVAAPPQRRGRAMVTGAQRRREAAAAGRPWWRWNPRGRPSAYTEEIAERILEGLAQAITLLEICDDEGMPTPRTVHSWVAQNREGFSARYHEARAAGCQILENEILLIAEDGRNDWLLCRHEAGAPQRPLEVMFDHEHVQRSRLRIEARQWLLSKIMPRNYGRRPDLTAQPEGRDTFAEFMKAVNGKSRGLPKDDVEIRFDEASDRWVIDGGEHDGEPA